MKQYKVEVLVHYSSLTATVKQGKDHIGINSQADIQQKLGELAGDGWRLVSTSAAGFGMALYNYLYFESDSDTSTR
jgi:hypothetical protein